MATNKRSQGKQCAAFSCTSRKYEINEAGERINSGICLFRFPQDTAEKKSWYNHIKRQDNKDGFKVTPETVLCEKHFEKDQIYRPPGGTRHRLLPNNRSCTCASYLE